ncbi:hypothetical protein A3B85_03060 [Candidatus Nomurabacteria bacterium RIFCSPHIGHO2_02_FULL_37_13]|uniref:Uncharacterized protein n=1 Tax=Candidatus Nomurabacteria bacterium RIFCSPHIGHO2_02_FULL_37_13 TaxID=1801750 RepID=A0A1F6W4P4_9BACT|nr:MAG: hypothetical protein A2640_03225 [Candidatus Nomurabacteria bacterium RIFCSPHIGHO2_01_FULL_36_23]OGI76736.1 MAG: hypothetical protein A3B85_03060 [Candidatus Nomurabacteria bacterium RIFCSPHIGHO2_02_FULL_37_13]OGI88464.1 MAG: hypothetical protein A2906_01160 [Candidatus Nomurabacteria bacterium RIFCSPLOWO2_01_FULL_37_25]
MFEIFFKIIFLIFILPVLIFFEGFSKFKALMNKKNWWWIIPYFLIVVLIILLLILWGYGYR